MRKLVFILTFLISFTSMRAGEKVIGRQVYGLFYTRETTEFARLAFTNIEKAELFRPSPLFRRFQDKIKRNRRITASVLAFPFPFGIVGLHRIYLGCEPYVPVVYIGTLGGVFGLLPLIDFFVIAFDKNTEKYLNNPHVFMWIEQ